MLRFSLCPEVGTGFHSELTGRENLYLNGAMLGIRKGKTCHERDKFHQRAPCPLTQAGKPLGGSAVLW